MMTNEELQALGTLIEEKLNPVNERMDIISACYESTTSRMGEMNAAIHTLNTRTGTMTAQMNKMEASMTARMNEMEASMTAQFSEVNEKLNELKFEMDTVYEWVDRMDLDVKDLKNTHNK